MIIQAMKMALVELQRLACDYASHGAAVKLRDAIEAAERQEPVAEVTQEDINQIVWLAPSLGVGRGSKLYTTPQPAIPADVIRQAQAQALRDAADRLELQNWDSAADELRRMADELERKA